LNQVYRPCLGILVLLPSAEGIDYVLYKGAFMLKTGKGMIVYAPTGKELLCGLITEIGAQLAGDEERFGNESQTRDASFISAREKLRDEGLDFTTLCIMFPNGVKCSVDNFQDENARLISVYVGYRPRLVSFCRRSVRRMVPL